VADPISHGVHAGAFYGFTLRMAQAPDLAVALAFVYGCLEGSAPDVLDWVGAKLGMFPRWELYNRFHKGDLRNSVIGGLPGIALHVKLIDPWMHKAGEAWWPREWKKEIACIGLALFGIFLTFF